MTKKRDRFFAGFGALLFLVTGSALTIAVIVTGISNHKQSQKDTQAQTQPANNCDQSVNAPAEAVPEVYKPTGSVSGLVKTDLQPGSGATVQNGECVQVKYYGTLAKDGTVFDENFDKTTAFQFTLGQGQVIKGWDQGLVGAKVGSTRRLVVPAALGYGDQANGSIPANADLVFVVHILGAHK